MISPFLLQLTRNRLGQLGDAGRQGFQFALDAHQQVSGDGDGKAYIAYCLENVFRYITPFNLIKKARRCPVFFEDYAVPWSGPEAARALYERPKWFKRAGRKGRWWCCQ
jgi:hypothetical protein